MSDRIRKAIPGAIPWRERALTDPLAAALANMGATDEEAADSFAAEAERLRASLARWIERVGNPAVFLAGPEVPTYTREELGLPSDGRTVVVPLPSWCNEAMREQIDAALDAASGEVDAIARRAYPLVPFDPPKPPPPGFWHNHAEPCGVEGCTGGTRVGRHVLMAPAPLPVHRHDPAPTGDAGEPEVR